MRFKWDWDPGDGDFIQTALKLGKSVPIYVDWEQGLSAGVYPPLGYLAPLLASKLNLDPFIAGRIFNLTLWIGCTWGVWRLAGFLALVVFLGAGAGWLPIFNLKADPLVLALMLGSLAALLKPTPKIRLAAVLTALALLTKQSALPLAAGLAVGLALSHRPHAKRFVITLALILIPVTLTLEYWSHGFFLKTIFVFPYQWFNQPYWQSSEHFLNLLFTYWSHWRLCLIPLVIFGIHRAIKDRSSPHFLIACVFISDLIYQVFSARFFGAGTPYFWLHWTGVALLVGRTRIHPLVKKLATLGAVIGLIVTLVTFDVPDPGRAQELGASYESLIRSLVHKDPSARWISERSSAGLTRAGILLDQEMCNFQFAYSLKPQSPGFRRLIQKLEKGYYTFYIQSNSTPCGLPLQIQPVLDSYFTKILTPQSTLYDRPISVAIYRYRNRDQGLDSMNHSGVNRTALPQILQSKR